MFKKIIFCILCALSFVAVNAYADNICPLGGACCGVPMTCPKSTCLNNCNALKVPPCPYGNYSCGQCNSSCVETCNRCPN